MSANELDRDLEAVLFVADEPVSPEELAKALETDPQEVEHALQRLEAALAERGIRLTRHRDRVQLVSAPEAAPAVRRFLGVPRETKLSTAALETLAIIAYRQPVTRAQIEAVRGVDSSGVLRTLLARELIEPVGNLPRVGRPVLYGTTPNFLHYLGITSLDELPELPEDVSEETSPDTPQGQAQV